MASLTQQSDSTLISKLESSTSTPILSLFTAHLQPFTDLTKSPPQSETQALVLTRSLAKRFLPFLNRSLSVLPKRLSNLSKSRPPENASNGVPSEFILELFDIYRLCLDSLELLAPQLSGKRYVLQWQRIKLVCSLEAWELYEEAECEVFRVLKRLRGLDLETAEKKEKNKMKRKEEKAAELLPGYVENGDAEFAHLVVEAVVLIVKCVVLRKSLDDSEYKKVLQLLQEVKPWFMVLDASTYEKLHRVLVTYLKKCTLFLVEELKNMGEGIANAFCVAVLNEYAKSSMKDQTYKVARRICSSLFLIDSDTCSVIINLLICLLDSLAQKCEFEGEHWRLEFVDLVSYIASKCQTATTSFCRTIGEHLNDISRHFSQQVMTPDHLILRLYATGLSLNVHTVKSRADVDSSSKVAKEVPNVSVWIDEDMFSDVVSLLGSLQNYFRDNRKYKSLSEVEFKGSLRNACSQLDCHCGTSSTCMQNNQDVYLLAYFNVLKFLCEPLAELVNVHNNHNVADGADAAFPPVLCSVQDAFHQFCDVFLYIHGTTTEGDGIEGNKLMVAVAVAAFTVSIKTKVKLKKSVHVIKHIMSSGWIQPRGLKDIFSSLYRVGVHLYRNKNTTEASKAFILCCKASWMHVVLLCEKFMKKPDEFGTDLSKDAILDSVAEASRRTASLLDVVSQCDSLKVKKIIVNSLENWAVAEDLFSGLPGPMPLVQQWVKIVCKLNKNLDADDNIPTLNCLLSSSVHISKRTIERFLEMELLFYEEMEAMFPELCQRMQIKIANILLENLSVTKDNQLQKLRILIRKGRVLRAYGSEGLVGSIQCLSEAISSNNDGTCSSNSPICHQLAVAYCLRALCTQEAEPHSKRIFEDIRASLNLWLSIPIPHSGFGLDGSSMLPDSMLVLLYIMIDLLSIKGTVQFHSDIYTLLIRVFKWKNLQLEKCLFILWESRRLSHAICVSPVNEALITSLSKDFGEQFNSIDFWINCLKAFPHSLVGFQQNFSFLFTNSCHASCNHQKSFPSATTADNIKDAALELLSSVPLTSCSLFIAGYLYYDICERLIVNGHLFEALSYAKEAYRMRTKLFQEKFAYSVEKQAEKCNDNADHVQKRINGNLQVHKSIACEIWSFDTISLDIEACYLSPWKVLQCYLESTLQVGVILETIGNGVEAENFLLLGKDISCSQSLPLFKAVFCSVLGKLYRKKHSWDLAEKELQSAKHALSHSYTAFSCLKCRLMLEVTVDMELGELYRSHVCNGTGNVSTKKLFHAENLYKTALEKLNLSEWKNSISCPQRIECDLQNAFATSQGDAVDFVSTRGKKMMDAAKTRKTRNVSRSLLKEQSSLTENNRRLTRSRYRSSQSQNVNRSPEMQVNNSRHVNGKDINELPDAINLRKSLEVKNCSIDLGCTVTCVCNKMCSWFCLASEVMGSGLLSQFVCIKWEFARRRLSLKILTGIGKCLDSHAEIHEIHGIISQSISTLVSRNPFISTDNPIPLALLLDSVGKELSGDVFAIERAALLYRICWFSLKSYTSKTACCDLSHIPLLQIVSWLKLAFVRCCEVPTLFQKVSRLLCAIYILSSSNEDFALPFCSRGITESHWASYFHQASLGTHLNYQFSANMIAKCKAQNLVNDQISHMIGSAGVGLERCDTPRLAPESPQDLENFVKSFFSDFPCTTVICISLIGGSLAKLLGELLLYPSHVSAWMVLSRLNIKNRPVVMLLPLDSILEEASDGDGNNSAPDELGESNELSKHWHCPWGFTVVDDVAPAFKHILEENYLSSSAFPLDDTKENRALWWMRRKKLDSQLGQLLRKIEDSWFGPWRFVLLGERSNSAHLDSVQKKLVRDLKVKCKMDVDGSVLTVILAGAGHGLEREVCHSQLLSLRKGCFIGEPRNLDEVKSAALSSKTEEAGKQSGLAVQLLFDAITELEVETVVNREPVILVLDCEVQMLPWENLPTLRNQEVYRMPSVGSIYSMLNKSCQLQKHGSQLVASFPLIDPMDAFYLLNPSGDLMHTQVEFENWFKDQNFEGKAGSAPTAEELALALKNRDLFIYLGHGSGAQYISHREIQKLEDCAATLLMGCSSGSLSLNGCYVPQGTVLSYLQAGSPVIVANLWEVTDKDIDRFAKAMLDAWLRERSSSSSDCPHCNLLAKEFEALNIKGSKGNAKKKAPKKKAIEDGEIIPLKDVCDHRPKLGSFMGQARDACTLPFLIGASPVCYGVPTGIRRKKDL